MGIRCYTSVVVNAEWPLLAGSVGCQWYIHVQPWSVASTQRCHKCECRAQSSKVLKGLHILTTLVSHNTVSSQQFSAMAKQKKSSSAVHMGETVIAAPGVVQTTMLTDQPTKVSSHTREELALVETLPITLDANADDAAADTEQTSQVESQSSSAS
jgi:hypothetical protein